MNNNPFQDYPRTPACFKPLCIENKFLFKKKDCLKTNKMHMYLKAGLHAMICRPDLSAHSQG